MRPLAPVTPSGLPLPPLSYDESREVDGCTVLLYVRGDTLIAKARAGTKGRERPDSSGIYFEARGRVTARAVQPKRRWWQYKDKRKRPLETVDQVIVRAVAKVKTAQAQAAERRAHVRRVLGGNG